MEADVERMWWCRFYIFGRSFMYGVGALGNKGGEHTASLIKTELLQQLEQLL